MSCVFTQLFSGIANGSTITLGAATNNQNLMGHNWILDLSGEDIGGSYFTGSKDVSGIGTCSNGSQYKFAGGIAPVLSTVADSEDTLAYYVKSATEILISAAYDWS